VKAMILCALFIFVTPAVCLAATTCSYINMATSTGILGAPVQLAMRHTTSAGDVCDYTTAGDQERRHLHVEVRPVSDSARDFATSKEGCKGKPEVVHALGNEAWSCNLRDAPYGMAIFGRVRNMLFIVRVMGISDDAVLSDKSSLAAEIVANNLY
jgi:hypothetical protein